MNELSAIDGIAIPTPEMIAATRRELAPWVATTPVFAKQGIAAGPDGATLQQALQASGVIELFGAVINPEKLGQVVSTFLDIQVTPAALESVAQELADCNEVVSLYIMSDLRSLHVHALTDSVPSFEAFARRHLFNRPEILSVDCKTLLTRVKNRRGGARL